MEQYPPLHLSQVIEHSIDVQEPVAQVLLNDQANYLTARGFLRHSRHIRQRMALLRNYTQANFNVGRKQKKKQTGINLDTFQNIDMSHAYSDGREGGEQESVREEYRYRTEHDEPQSAEQFVSFSGWSRTAQAVFTTATATATPLSTSSYRSRPPPTESAAMRPDADRSRSGSGGRNEIRRERSLTTIDIPYQLHEFGLAAVLNVIVTALLLSNTLQF